MQCCGAPPMVIFQATNFWKEIEYSNDVDGEDPVDVTGYTARLVFAATMVSEEVIFEATTENGLITVDGPAGKFIINAPKSVTELLPAPWNGIYQFTVTNANGSMVTRLLEGEASIIPNTPQAVL